MIRGESTWEPIRTLETVQPRIPQRIDELARSHDVRQCRGFGELETDALRRQGGEDILVVVGGVIPPSDRKALEDAGVAAIYPPGTHIPDAAREILQLLRARHKERAA